MECFNCHEELPDYFFASPENDMCFCSQPCLIAFSRSIYRPRIEARIEANKNILKDADPTMSRVLKTEIVVLRAILGSAEITNIDLIEMNKQHLKNLKEILMLVYVEALEKHIEYDLSQQAYLKMADSTKKSIDRIDEYILAFS